MTFPALAISMVGNQLNGCFGQFRAISSSNSRRHFVASSPSLIFPSRFAACPQVRKHRTRRHYSYILLLLLLSSSSLSYSGLLCLLFAIIPVGPTYTYNILAICHSSEQEMLENKRAHRSGVYLILCNKLRPSLLKCPKISYSIMLLKAALYRVDNVYWFAYNTLIKISVKNFSFLIIVGAVSIV